MNFTEFSMIGLFPVPYFKKIEYLLIFRTNLGLNYLITFLKSGRIIIVDTFKMLKYNCRPPFLTWSIIQQAFQNRSFFDCLAISVQIYLALLQAWTSFPDFNFGHYLQSCSFRLHLFLIYVVSCNSFMIPPQQVRF